MKIERGDVVSVLRKVKMAKIPTDLRFDVSFADQGIDSLGMFEIILALQEHYALDIPDSDIDALRTVDDLVGYLNTHVSQ